MGACSTFCGSPVPDCSIPGNVCMFCSSCILAVSPLFEIPEAQHPSKPTAPAQQFPLFTETWLSAQSLFHQSSSWNNFNHFPWCLQLKAWSWSCCFPNTSEFPFAFSVLKPNYKSLYKILSAKTASVALPLAWSQVKLQWAPPSAYPHLFLVWPWTGFLLTVRLLWNASWDSLRFYYKKSSMY